MSYRNYNPANGFIVAKDNTGDWTNIGAAISAASAGTTIFLRPGNYVEDLIMKDGVNITAWSGDDNEANVTISGKISFSNAGTVTISNVRLQTNNDYLLEVTGSVASIVNLESCTLNMTNHTGIHYTSSSASSEINLDSCNGDIGTTGITLYTMSSAGIFLNQFSYITNSGGSTTISSNSAGAADHLYCNLVFPVGTSSSGILLMSNTYQELKSLNVTAITANGSGGTRILNTFTSCGTASAISVGTGNQLSANFCFIDSSNTNAVTGLGTIQYTNLIFTGSSNTINTTTQTPFLQLPGKGVIQQVRTTFSTATDCPSGFSATVQPTNTTGTQILSLAITPTSTQTVLLIEAIAQGQMEIAASSAFIALFQDSTVNALAAATNFCSSVGAPTIVTLRYTMTSGTASSTTFKIRAGGDSNKWFVNANNSGTQYFGGATFCMLTITEFGA